MAECARCGRETVVLYPRVTVVGGCVRVGHLCEGCLREWTGRG